MMPRWSFLSPCRRSAFDRRCRRIDVPWRGDPSVHLIASLIVALGTCLVPQPVEPAQASPIDRAFGRLYNFDFTGAHAILDAHIRTNPDEPLPHAVKAAAHLYSELDRLKILQVDFFMDDDRVVDRNRLTPSPRTREAFFGAIDDSTRRARRILSTRPEDPDALFSLCMTTGLVTDYAALVERRRFGSFPLARQNQVWVGRLLSLDPPVYDAYLTRGAAEYVVSRIHILLRWLVHIDGVQGSRERAIDSLELVASRGRYYGPFARILLSVIHLRDRRPQEAERLLAGLAAEFPENPLIRRELQNARARVRTMASVPQR